MIFFVRGLDGMNMMYRIKDAEEPDGALFLHQGNGASEEEKVVVCHRRTQISTDFLIANGSVFIGVNLWLEVLIYLASLRPCVGGAPVAAIRAKSWLGFQI